MGNIGKFVVFLHKNGRPLVVVAGQHEWHMQIKNPKDTSEKIVAAGRFKRNSDVIGWRSYGLQVTTPQNLRKPIEQVFKKNRKLILEKWQS